MGSKNFQEEQAGLREGLNSLNKIIKTHNSRFVIARAIKNKEIQKVRMEWLARGYHMKEKEIRDQKKLESGN